MKKIPIEMWDDLQKRVEAIYPFVVNQIPRTTDNFEWQAKESGVHVTTIYRWLKRYEETGDVLSLLFPKKTGGQDKSRLSFQVDAKIGDFKRE